MEDTIIQELASRGTVSWLLTRGLFLVGLVALMTAAVQTSNPWIWAGLIGIAFAEAIDRRRLSDPDNPMPSWWPWA